MPTARSPGGERAPASGCSIDHTKCSTLKPQLKKSDRPNNFLVILKCNKAAAESLWRESHAPARMLVDKPYQCVTQKTKQIGD
jgi:hypothetical protein